MMAGARIAFLVVLAPLLATGLAGAQLAERDTGDARRAPAAVAGPLLADAFRSTRTFPAVAAPVKLRVPAVRLASRLQRLGRQGDGTIAVPRSPHVAGWYQEGPRPGQPGPAVIVGHVDSRNGPGVFVNLSRLPRGAIVHVDRADGSTVSFRVTRVSRVAKERFPTDRVYSPTLRPSLQLVTCGGPFDRHRRSYRDNVIVYTVPA
jgi:Sortase domain